MAQNFGGIGLLIAILHAAIATVAIYWGKPFFLPINALGMAIGLISYAKAVWY